jgi:predicted metal-binding membrane protein
VLSSLTAPALSRRDRAFILTSIVLITGLAWAYLFYLDHRMKAAMEYDNAMAAMGMTVSAAWTAGDAGFAFAMWTVMMVGMMAPAAAPVLVLFAAAHTKRTDPGAWPAVFIFGFGYAVVWTAFSAGATFVQWALQQRAMLTGAMAAAGPRLAAAILIIVGIYQLTPWKGRCLTHCRSPLGFLMSHWRDGKLGSFKMGLRHGVYCVGCCWALMGALFVVGVMNLFWVAMLTAFVLLEKVGPAGAMIARIAGAGMILLGVLKILKMT